MNSEPLAIIQPPPTDARYFAALLESGYAERLGYGERSESIKDGWGFDEYNGLRVLILNEQTTTMRFSNHHRTRPACAEIPNTPYYFAAVSGLL